MMDLFVQSVGNAIECVQKCAYKQESQEPLALEASQPLTLTSCFEDENVQMEVFIGVVSAFTTYLSYRAIRYWITNQSETDKIEVDSKKIYLSTAEIFQNIQNNLLEAFQLGDLNGFDELSCMLGENAKKEMVIYLLEQIKFWLKPELLASLPQPLVDKKQFELNQLSNYLNKLLALCIDRSDIESFAKILRLFHLANIAPPSDLTQKYYLNTLQKKIYAQVFSEAEFARLAEMSQLISIDKDGILKLIKQELNIHLYGMSQNKIRATRCVNYLEQLVKLGVLTQEDTEESFEAYVSAFIHSHDSQYPIESYITSASKQHWDSWIINAVKSKNYATALYLLDKIDEVSESVRDALSEACVKLAVINNPRNIQLMSLLVKYGASPLYKDSEALYRALLDQCYDNAEWLIKNGADVYARQGEIYLLLRFAKHDLIQFAYEQTLPTLITNWRRDSSYDPNNLVWDLQIFDPTTKYVNDNDRIIYKTVADAEKAVVRYKRCMANKYKYINGEPSNIPTLRYLAFKQAQSKNLTNLLPRDAAGDSLYEINEAMQILNVGAFFDLRVCELSFEQLNDAIVQIEKDIKLSKQVLSHRLKEVVTQNGDVITYFNWANEPLEVYVNRLIYIGADLSSLPELLDIAATNQNFEVFKSLHQYMPENSTDESCNKDGDYFRALMGLKTRTNRC